MAMLKRALPALPSVTGDEGTEMKCQLIDAGGEDLLPTVCMGARDPVGSERRRNMSRATLVCAASALCLVLLAASAAAADEAVVMPEVRYALISAQGEGMVTDDLAKVTLRLALRIFGKGQSVVPVLPNGVSVTNVKITKGKDKYIYLRRTAGGYEFLATREGYYEARVQYVQRVVQERSTRSLTLPVVPAVTAVTEISLPWAPLEVEVEGGLNFAITEPKKDTTLVALYGGDGREVTVKWTSKVIERQLAPIVFAEQNALLTVGRGVLSVDATVNYTILQGVMNDLKLAVPADVTLLNVHGDNIKTWDVVKGGDEKVLAISLLSEEREAYSLSLKLEKALGKIPITFDVPAIVVKNVERENGFLAISAIKGLQAESKQTGDVTQVDVRELPSDLSREGVPIHLGFKYLSRPFSINVTASEVEAKVIGEVSSVIKVSREALRMTSDISYDVKDAGVFQFNIGLSEGLKLVDLEGENINNWSLEANRLVISLRSKAEGEYKLRLATEAMLTAADAPVTMPAVTLLDATRERGYVALSAATGIKVDAVDADVSQVNVTDLPPGAFAKDEQIDLAYRYIRPGYAIRVAISDVVPEIAAVVHTLVSVDDKDLKVFAGLHYDIQKAGIFQLELSLPKRLRIVNVVGKTIDNWKHDADAGTLTVALTTKTEGRYDLFLECEKSIDDLLVGIDVPAITTVNTKKETGYIAVHTPASIRLRTDPGKQEQVTEIDVKDLPPSMRAAGGVSQRQQPAYRDEVQWSSNKPVTLAYRYFQTPWRLGLLVEQIEPHVSAEVFSFLSVGEAQIHTSSTIKYTILYAGIQDLSFRLPKGVTNVDVEGEDIRTREENKEDGTWKIGLQSRKQGEYRLFITFQLDLADASEDVAFEGVEVLDVKRETGYLAVAPRSDVEILALDEKTKSLTPIDQGEIPDDYKVGIDIPILLSFRYLKHPYSAGISMTKHDAADVLVAVVEVCKLSSVVSEEGQVITDLVCLVRNTRKQYLEIELPPESNIWQVFVAGNEVIPMTAKELRGKKTIELTLIPIAGYGKGDRPVPVRVRYAHDLGKLGKLGTLRLTVPAMKIDILRLGWEVWLPKEYRVISDAGNMRRVDALERTLHAVATDVRGELLRADAAAAPNEDVPAWRGQQMQRQKTQGKSMSYQHRSNVMVQEITGDRNVQRASVAREGFSVSDVMITGSKPAQGRPYCYESIVSLLETGTIRARYVKRSMNAVIIGLMLIVLVVGGIVAWQRSSARPLAKFIVAVAIAVLFLGIRTLGEDSYSGYLSIVFWSALLVPIIGCVRWCGVRAKGILDRRAARSGAHRAGEPVIPSDAESPESLKEQAHEDQPAQEPDEDSPSNGPVSEDDPEE